MSEREFVSKGCHRTHASRLDRWENVGIGLWVLFTGGTVTDLLGLTGGRSRFRRRSLRLVEYPPDRIVGKRDTVREIRDLGFKSSGVLRGRERQGQTIGDRDGKFESDRRPSLSLPTLDDLIFPVLPFRPPPSVPISLTHPGSAHPVSLCSYFLDLPPSLSEPAATTKRPVLTGVTAFALLLKPSWDWTIIGLWGLDRVLLWTASQPHWLPGPPNHEN